MKLIDFSINYPYNSKCEKAIFSFNFSFDKTTNYIDAKLIRQTNDKFFLFTFFCVHATWWQDFATLTIHVSSLPFFLKAKSPIFAISFFEKSPKQSKDPKGPPFAK